MRASILILLCLLPRVTLAHDMPMSSSATLGASAAFDAHGRLWVVDAADGHVRLRHSDDFGETLGAPVEVNPVAEPIYDEGENRPKIAFGPADEIYVSWSQPRAKPWTGFVRFARSLDGGRSFSAPITVHRDRAEITHRFDALAVDGHGRIVVAWIDKRDLEAAEAHGKPYLGAAVYYAWSDDRGASFTRERKLADQTCECCRIALARTPQGDVGAFFRAVYGDNIRDHAYALLRRADAAVTPQRASFERWHIAGCPHHGPGLAIDGNGVRHAVWYEAKDGPAIHYGQLDPGHPPRHERTLAGAGASHADVAAQGNTVRVAWNRIDAEGHALMLRTSRDGGRDFDAPRAIAHASGAVGAPQLLAWRGRAWVAWNTANGFRLVPAENP